MNEDPPPLSADRMPTLTEVVELDVPAAQEPVSPPQGDALPPGAAALPSPGAAPTLDAQALVGEALAELQPRIEMLLESRLREALAPALARAAEGLIRDARDELGTALHELVEDAVKRALQRRGLRR